MAVVHVRKCLYGILFICFIGFMSQAIQDLSNPKEGLTFDSSSNGELPSITICPADAFVPVFQKFEDYHQSPSLLDFTSVESSIFHNGGL